MGVVGKEYWEMYSMINEEMKLKCGVSPSEPFIEAVMARVVENTEQDGRKWNSGDISIEIKNELQDIVDNL